MNTSEVLQEVRRAINKGWWNISNSYLLHDKPLSEILGAIDHAIALAKAEERDE